MKQRVRRPEVVIISWEEECAIATGDRSKKWGVRATFCQGSWHHKALNPFQYEREIYLSPLLTWFLEILSWKVLCNDHSSLHPSCISAKHATITAPKPMPDCPTGKGRCWEVMHNSLIGWLEQGCANVSWRAQWTEMCILCCFLKKILSTEAISQLLQEGNSV